MAMALIEEITSSEELKDYTMADHDVCAYCGVRAVNVIFICYGRVGQHAKISFKFLFIKTSPRQNKLWILM